MFRLNNKIKAGFFAFATLAIFSSCNKNVDQLPDITYPINAGKGLADVLATIPADSLYNKLVVRSGLAPTINNLGASFTLFVPDNAAMKSFVTAATGGAIPATAPDAAFVNFLNTTLPIASVQGIVGYNIVPQKLPLANIPTSFPNIQYPTILNPAPQLSALLRLTTFPSKRGSINWVNNVPITAGDVAAGNGLIHTTAAVVAPPSRYLWDTINNGSDFTYLKAAIQRADSGVAAASTLAAALQNIGANLTVFAPSNLAFQQLLTAQITQALIAQGTSPAVASATATALASTPAVFTNPALWNVLTPTTVKGLVVYHILGSRAFSVNLPTAATNVPTLLNTAIPLHPGISIQAVFAANGVSVASATVKGAANATAATIAINPTPAPNGTSDQLYLNGILHKINQVLLPQ